MLSMSSACEPTQRHQLDSRLFGLVALAEEEHTGREGDDEQQRGGDERPAQASLAALLTCQLGADRTVVALGPVPAGVDQFGDQRRHVAAPRRPVGRRLEPAAAQHVVVGSSLRVPAACCGTQVALEREVGPRLLQPGDHLRPGAEHDLVHDVDRLAGAGHEPGVDERVDRRAELRRQVGGVNAATDPGTVVGDVDQAQHPVAQRRAPVGTDGRQGAFAETFDRGRQATDARRRTRRAACHRHAAPRPRPSPPTPAAGRRRGRRRRMRSSTPAPARRCSRCAAPARRRSVAAPRRSVGRRAPGRPRSARRARAMTPERRADRRARRARRERRGPDRARGRASGRRPRRSRRMRAPLRTGR